MDAKAKLTAVIACLAMLFAAPVSAAWTFMIPLGGGTYGPTSVVSGSGAADAADAGLSGEFAFGTYTEENGQITSFTAENTVLVTATLIMPGMAVWQTSTGQLAPPVDGWDLSPVEMGMPVADHAVRLIPPTGDPRPIYYVTGFKVVE